MRIRGEDMKRRIQFKVLGLLILPCLLLLGSCKPGSSEAAAEAQGALKVAAKAASKSFDGGRFKLSWKLEEGKLKVKIASGYKGYMGFGINTKGSMTGADLIVIRMIEDGKVVVEDQYCKSGKMHKLDTEFGGTSRIVKQSGGTNNGWTSVEFVLEALSDDPYDVRLEPGNEYYFLVAASDKNSMKAFHSFHEKFKVKF
jgi:hypothetical protein